MLRNDDQWLEISDAFSTAALGGDWQPALNGLADACGAWTGELIGVGADNTVPFNWMPRVDPEASRELVRIGAGGPQTNPRVRIGLRTPVMQAWHDADCSNEDQLRRNFAYADLCRRFEIPHGSQATLIRGDGLLIGLAVLRTSRQGAPQGEDRLAFERLSGQVRSAVKMQLALEGRGAELLAGALEPLGLAVFVCDGQGAVRALTPEAEQRVRQGWLRLRDGRLSAAGLEDARRLEDAISRARVGVLRPGDEPMSTLVLGCGDGAQGPEIVDVIALPRAPFAFGFEPRVLVVARGTRRRPGESERLLRMAYGLTATEAAIATRLGAGDGTEEIAAHRQVSASTIRTHVKAIFQKMNVGRRSEVAARLARF